MKTVLAALNARYAHSSLALRYLKCRNAEFDIHLREFSINDTAEHIYAALLREEADVYGFSCYIWNAEMTYRLAEMIKTALPQATVLLGGPEAGSNARRILQRYPWVDMVMVGEGEETLHDLLSALQGGKSVSRIDGLALRGEPLHLRKPMDLSTMPQPYTRDDILQNKEKILYFETSRGCPFHCAYCLSSAENTVRPFPMDYVKEGLQRFFDAGVPLVKLIDRTFNYDAKRAVEILRFILKNSKETCVHMELEPRILTEELIAVLGSAPRGKFQIEMGIQTIQPQTLRAVNRVCDLRTTAENIRKLRAFDNMHIHLDLIAGLPYEDYDGFKQSFAYVYDLKPHMLQLGFLKVLPATAIANQNGIFASTFPPYEVIKTDWISAQELCRLKEVEAAVELFYNSGAFAKTIDRLTQKEAFAVFEELGSLIRKESKNGKKKRKDWYEILYQTYGEALQKPLSEDFIRHNKSIPLPEFTRPQREHGFKDAVYRLMKREEFCDHYGVEPDPSVLRFERMDGRAWMMDYRTNRLFDITEDLQRYYAEREKTEPEVSYLQNRKDMIQ